MTRLKFFSLLLALQLGLAVGVVHAAAPVAKSPIAVTNPPLVQMLVPGFTVRELPLALRNLNNLVYAPDGRLFALGYDGNVYQLKDTDGDGLEDASTLFFDNTRAEIPPSIGMAWGPGGLYLASRGRVLHQCVANRPTPARSLGPLLCAWRRAGPARPRWSPTPPARESGRVWGRSASASVVATCRPSRFVTRADGPRRCWAIRAS